MSCATILLVQRKLASMILHIIDFLGTWKSTKLNRCQVTTKETFPRIWKIYTRKLTVTQECLSRSLNSHTYFLIFVRVILVNWNRNTNRSRRRQIWWNCKCKGSFSSFFKLLFYDHVFQVCVRLGAVIQKYMFCLTRTTVNCTLCPLGEVPESPVRTSFFNFTFLLKIQLMFFFILVFCIQIESWVLEKKTCGC